MKQATDYYPLFHVKITLQYCFSSEKENGDIQAKALSLSSLSGSHIHLGVMHKTNAKKRKTSMKSEKRTEF